MRRFRSSIWLLLGIGGGLLAIALLAVPTAAIEQVTSTNFTVNESAINNGGGTRQSTSFVLWTDSVGEGVIGVMSSTNFIAYTSFVPAATHSAGVPVEVSSFRLE